MKTCAIILARGGSKGVPNKNTRLVKSKPLIQYTIDAASPVVDEVFVSTNDQDIADISSLLGASIIQRPDKYATDTASSESALIHAVMDERVKKYETIVFIQPTSPLVTTEDIRKGVELQEWSPYDSVFSAYKEHWIPKWSLTSHPLNWKIDDRPRRQDKDEVYVENGAFYITSRRRLIDTGLRYSGNIGICEMPMSRSFQIDTFDDLHLVEKLL